MTHTYVTLEVSFSTWHEIKNKLHAAGYDHALETDKQQHVILIDMHGIALVKEPEKP